MLPPRRQHHCRRRYHALIASRIRTEAGFLFLAATAAVQRAAAYAAGRSPIVFLYMLRRTSRLFRYGLAAVRRTHNDAVFAYTAHHHFSLLEGEEDAAVTPQPCRCCHVFLFSSTASQRFH